MDNIYIEFLIIDKGGKFDLPEGLINFNLVRRSYDLPEWANRNKVNFSKQDLVIMYIDPLRFKHNSIEKIYKEINAYTGVTKAQIKGKRGKDNVAFARQLFHYFYITSCLGGREKAGVETNNNHATVTHSMRKIENIRFESPQRKNIFNELVKIFPDRRSKY